MTGNFTVSKITRPKDIYPLVYFNGFVVPYESAVLPVASPVLHYGLGSFEGIRAYWNEKEERLFVFRLEDHYERLKRSAQTLVMTLPADVISLCDSTVDLLWQNQVKGDVYIRPLVYKKTPTVVQLNLDKLEDGFVIVLQSLGHYLDVLGMSVITSSWKRLDSSMIPVGAKPVAAYLNSALAKTEAARQGAGEAILLNNDGTVAEGSAENIFLVKDGKLITPATSQNILVGVTRQTVMELAKKEFDVDTDERPVLEEELYRADEIFFTGTGAEIAPVVSINNCLVGSGTIGLVTDKLQQLYFRVVHGEEPTYGHWLTAVP